MSAVVYSQTPFISRSILLQALERIGESYIIYPNGKILTNRRDYYGREFFELRGNAYVLRHDSSANGYDYGAKYPWGNLKDSSRMLVRDFLMAVGGAYKEIMAEELEKLRHIEEERLAEEEATRLKHETEEREAARIAFIKQQEQTIIERAKADGYYVARKEIGDKIRITLSRTR